MNALRRWRDRFAVNLLEQAKATDRLHQWAENIYANEGVGEAFAPWLDRFCRQLAIQFILKVLFIRVLEDRGLLKIRRIRSRDSQQLFEALAPHLGATSYLRIVFRDVVRLLPALFEEGEQDFLWPADDLSQEFLEEVWRRPDVEREGRLRYDFRGDGEGGFDTRFIGDLYQDIDPEAREYYALLQTPEFISNFILEHTLIECFDEKDYREVTLIDPTCGSGHFLVDAFYIFARRYLDAGNYLDTPDGKARLAINIIERHLYGADINAYACALARFRLMLAACDFACTTDLEAFRDQRFNIVCCDSLIPYEDPDLVRIQTKFGQGQAEAEEEEQQRFGSPDTIAVARNLFRKEYDVVVGNPPYISVKDDQKRDYYRKHYDAAYGKYGLVAPFTERFLEIASEKAGGGHIGMIVSNAFARRQFGKMLVEEVIPKYDLGGVIDLDGAYVPGHGTPTLIMFLRRREAQSEYVSVLSNLKGEPHTPADPSKGNVWQSVVHGYAEGHGYQDEYVDVYDRPREALEKHPWQFGGPAARLHARILSSSPGYLADQTDGIGFDAIIGQDEVYIHRSDYLRRACVEIPLIRPLIIGEWLRDWAVAECPFVIFPYSGDQPVDLTNYPGAESYLRRYKDLLEERVYYGKSHSERGLAWYEYAIVLWDKRKSDHSIVFASITTHNHFLLTGQTAVRKDSSKIVSLKQDEGDYLFAVGLLNSSVVCFSLKQICFNKGSGVDPVRDRFDYSATNVGRTPLPRSYQAENRKRKTMSGLIAHIIERAKRFSGLGMHKLFENKNEAYHSWNTALGGYVPNHPDLPEPFRTAQELELGRDCAIELRRDIRQHMMFLQEEMDWMAYEMYSLIPRAPLAENYLSPDEIEGARLELGQRAFEQASNGYKGDWRDSWKEDAQDHLPGPAARLPELSENMKRLIQDRIEIIRTNEDIALLEDPLYKRRWIPPDYDKEFMEALEWWMREMAEWELEWAGKPLHIKEWSRRLMAHERVRAALEVYCGTPTYDPVVTIEKIVKPEAVPNRPEHFMRASGLRKLARGEMEFKRADFSDGNAWKVRGKLNIPRERYIAYREFEPGWYGWAGCDAEKRAEALVTLLEQAGTEGWSIHHRQCGLRASLRDLLPKLEDLPAAEQQEFETIAYLCGIREPCFCVPFRESDPEERPPGFDEPAIKQHMGETKSEQISLF